ncbi:MAG: O-antigen ligase family protein [Chitinophagales bacterium]
MSLLFAGFNGIRIFISLGVIALVVQALWFYPLKEMFQRFFHEPVMWSISCVFFILVLSGLNSENHAAWLVWLRMAVAFLAMPLAFSAFPSFEELWFLKVLKVFVVVMSISALAVLIHYGLHYETINKQIEMGSTIPVPFSHIRYNLLLVFASCCAFFLYEKRNDKKLWLALSVFLFAAIHFLASRSGWLALYSCILVRLVLYVMQTKKWKQALVVLLVLLLVPAGAYFVSDGLQAKVNYMRYDWNEFVAGRIEGRSDAMRLASWKTGVALVKENFWFGTGAGDIAQESDRMGGQLFPSLSAESRKMPHNEFLWMWAATGIFGLLTFCFAFLFPFVLIMKRGEWPGIALFLIFFTSFLSEYPLHEQVGSIFYLAFLLLFVNRYVWLKSVQ